MKKLLALVLALVMTLSLCTISNAAYKDAADVDLKEAVDVLTAVGVFQGDENGKMNPKANLTREQAAKLVAYLQVGQKAADALVGGSKFTDVAKTAWSAGYVDYCASTGVVNGVGDGKFDPAGSLTALQFGKMLLVCLGYDAVAEGMTGADWTINTSKLMSFAKLLKGLDAVNANTVITREQAAQMMLNALKAPMVEYTNKATTISVNGAVINFGGSTASYVTSTVAKDQTISTYQLSNKGGYTIELGEKLFPKLTLKPVEGDYGRPANEWKLGTKLIGDYTRTDATLVYTANTKQKDVYADLGDAVEYDNWTVYVDGVEQTGTLAALGKKSTDKYAYTDKGAVTEFYVDDVHESVIVVEINYYLGQVSSVKTDKSTGDETVTVTPKSKLSKTLQVKTIEADGFKKDDYVVFTVDVNEDDKVAVASIAAPETVTGDVTRVDKDAKTGDAFVKLADGSKNAYSALTVYDVADVGTKTHPTLTKEYKLYLDPNGYVLGFKLVTEEATDYLLVTDTAADLWDNVEAKVVFADGSKATVAIAEKFADETTYTYGNVAENTIYKYTVDKDNVYTLTVVTKQGVTGTVDAVTATGTISNGKASISTGSYTYIVDEDTVFVDIDAKKAYTGFEEVPNAENAKLYWALNKTGKIAEIVFFDGDVYDKDTTYFMLADTERDTVKYDKKEYTVYENAYVDGELVEDGLYVLTTRTSGDTAKTLTPGVVYQIKKTVDEQYITEVAKVAYTYTDLVNAVGKNAFWVTTTESADVQYTVDGDTKFIVFSYDADDEEYDIYAGSLADLKGDDTTAVYAWVKADSDKVAEVVYAYRTTALYTVTVDDSAVANLTATLSDDEVEFDTEVTLTLTNSNRNTDRTVNVMNGDVVVAKDVVVRHATWSQRNGWSNGVATVTITVDADMALSVVEAN